MKLERIIKIGAEGEGQKGAFLSFRLISLQLALFVNKITSNYLKLL